MPVYKDRDKWRVRIYHRGKHADWIIAGTKEDALAFEARKRVEMEQAGGFPETRVAPTFLNFCVGRYKPHAKVQLKARTWENRQYTLANLIGFFGDDKLTEISTERATAYQRMRTQAGIAPSTVNDEVKVLRAVLNLALYLQVPACKLVVKDLPVRKRKRLLYWSAEQARALIAAVSEHSPALYWLVVFLLETGCRRGEAIALEFQDVDFDRAIVRVQPNEEWQPKNNEAREIPLDREGALLGWLRDEQTSGRRHVFVSRQKDSKGRRKPFAYWPQLQFDRARMAAGYDAGCEACAEATETAKGKFRRGLVAVIACERHGLVGGPHTTRHTYATHFLARCPDLYLLSRILGHSHERVTKLYAHMLPEHLERARGAVSFGAAPLAGSGWDRPLVDSSSE